MTKYIAHAVAEPVAHLGDALMGYTGEWVVVAAVFDQHNLGIWWTRNMVVRLVHGPVEPV